MAFVFVSCYASILTAATQLTATWVSFQAKLTSTLASNSAFGQRKLYAVMTYPFLVTIIVCGFCSGINYSAFLIAARIGFLTIVLLFVVLATLTIVYGIKNVRRISAIGDKYNTRQQTRLHASVASVEIFAGIVVLLNVIFLDQICQVSGRFIAVNAAFRFALFCAQLGAAVYTWVGTTHLWESQSSRSTTRGSIQRPTGFTASGHSKDGSKVQTNTTSVNTASKDDEDSSETSTDQPPTETSAPAASDATGSV